MLQGLGVCIPAVHRYGASLQDALLFQVDLLQEVQHTSRVGGHAVVGPSPEVVLPNGALRVPLLRTGRNLKLQCELYCNSFRAQTSSLCFEVCNAVKSALKPIGYPQEHGAILKDKALSLRTRVFLSGHIKGKDYVNAPNLPYPPNMVAYDLLWSCVELLVCSTVIGDVMNL